MPPPKKIDLALTRFHSLSFIFSPITYPLLLHLCDERGYFICFCLDDTWAGAVPCFPFLELALVLFCIQGVYFCGSVLASRACINRMPGMRRRHASVFVRD